MDVSHGVPWEKELREAGINFLGLLTIHYALHSFHLLISRSLVAILTDSTMTVAYINHQGGTVSKWLCLLTVRIWEDCTLDKIFISAGHVPDLSQRGNIPTKMGAQPNVSAIHLQQMLDSHKRHLYNAGKHKVLWGFSHQGRQGLGIHGWQSPTPVKGSFPVPISAIPCTEQVSSETSQCHLNLTLVVEATLVSPDLWLSKVIWWWYCFPPWDNLLLTHQGMVIHHSVPHLMLIVWLINLQQGTGFRQW